MSATSKTSKLMNLAGTVAALLVTTSNAVAMPVANCGKMMDDVGGLRAQIQKVNIFVADNRVVQSRTGVDKSYGPIGGMQTNGKVPETDASGKITYVTTMSTAFLISPCYIVTNYHAVFGESKTPSSAGYSTSFYSITGQGQHYKKTNATPVDWGPMNRTGMVGDDWALLKLDTCVGQNLGWMEFATNDSSKMPGLSVSSSGFSIDKSLGDLWTDPACKIVKRDSGGGAAWLNTCALRDGGSGAPIVHVGADKVPRVVAIQSRSYHETDGVLGAYDDSHANVAVDIGAALGNSFDLIKADRATLKSNPAVDNGVEFASNQSGI